MIQNVKSSLKMIKAKDIQRIDDYRDGKLSGTERYKFESALETDPQLKHFLSLGEECQKILRLFISKPLVEESV